MAFYALRFSRLRDPRRHPPVRNWETSYAGKIGLGVAVEYALSWGIAAIEARVTQPAEGLCGRLRATDGVEVHDPGLRRRTRLGALLQHRRRAGRLVDALSW